MEDLSLHILDIVENSTAAGATLVEIAILQDADRDLLEVTIRDNGRGMDAEMVKNVRDPFVTSRTTRRVGLGISLLEQSTMEAEGSFDIQSELGKGTTVTAAFRLTHIDRKPLGDIGATMVALIMGNPGVDFLYVDNLGGEETVIDTREIKEQLDGLSITEPAVLQLIKNTVNENREE